MPPPRKRGWATREGASERPSLAKPTCPLSLLLEPAGGRKEAANSRGCGDHRLPRGAAERASHTSLPRPTPHNPKGGAAAHASATLRSMGRGLSPGAKSAPMTENGRALPLGPPSLPPSSTQSAVPTEALLPGEVGGDPNAPSALLLPQSPLSSHSLGWKRKGWRGSGCLGPKGEGRRGVLVS